MKLLILIAVLYLIWRSLKTWMARNMKSVNTDFRGPEREIDDVMVQDPYCHVYFPKRNGFHVNADGEDLYFCSSQCRDNFIASRSEQ